MTQSTPDRPHHPQRCSPFAALLNLPPEPKPAGKPKPAKAAATPSKPKARPATPFAHLLSGAAARAASAQPPAPMPPASPPGPAPVTAADILRAGRRVGKLSTVTKG